MSVAERASYPMEFSTYEFWRGAACAWTCFVALLVVVPLSVFALTDPASLADAMSGTILMLVVGIGAIVAAIAVLFFSPLVWLVATRLRGVRSVAAHLAVYAGLGTAIGVVMAWLVGMYFFGADPRATIANPWSWALVLSSTVSVVVGWSRSVWRARRG